MLCTRAGGLAWPPTSEKLHKLLKPSSKDLHPSEILQSSQAPPRRSTITASSISVSITEFLVIWIRNSSGVDACKRVAEQQKLIIPTSACVHCTLSHATPISHIP
jgi:hypothetical protein